MGMVLGVLPLQRFGDMHCKALALVHAIQRLERLSSLILHMLFCHGCGDLLPARAQAFHFDGHVESGGGRIGFSAKLVDSPES